MSFFTSEVSVRYHVHGDEHHATLTIRNENAATFLTAIHETYAQNLIRPFMPDLIGHDMLGSGCTEHIPVTSGETLTLLVRQAGLVIGSAVLEVDCTNADFGFILSPRGLCNMVLHQDAVESDAQLHKVAGNGALEVL